MSPGVASKLVVVSGAGSGLGRALALEAARHGYRLALLGRRAAALEETLALAPTAGAAYPCDVRDAGAVLRRAGEIQASLGVPELIVPAAGTATVRRLAEGSPEEFADVIATNLLGSYHVIRAFLPAMMLRGSGVILPLLSVAARRGFPGWTAYCASKWALAGLIAALREELGASGVRILELYPGATDTAIWDGLEGNWNRAAMMKPDEVARSTFAALATGGASVAIEQLHLGPLGGAL